MPSHGGPPMPPAAAQGRGGVDEMLQSFIQQVQSNGGAAALTNQPEARAQVLQVLQSNPQLVQALKQQGQQQQPPPHQPPQSS
eukprot:1375800-Rhodomonas_salina.1